MKFLGCFQYVEVMGKNGKNLARFFPGKQRKKKCFSFFGTGTGTAIYSKMTNKNRNRKKNEQTVALRRFDVTNKPQKCIKSMHQLPCANMQRHHRRPMKTSNSSAVRSLISLVQLAHSHTHTVFTHKILYTSK